MFRRVAFGCNFEVVHATEPRTLASSPVEGQVSMLGNPRAREPGTDMTVDTFSSGSLSRDPNGGRAQSRRASALRLVILLVVTGLMAALILVGVFVELSQQIHTASH